MKPLTILSLFLLASPVFSELTKEDVRTIIREEVTASEKRTKEYIDIKVGALDQRVDDLDKNLHGKINTLEKNLNDKIDDLDKNLHGKIDTLEKNLNNEIDTLEKNLNARIGDLWLLMVVLIGLITAAIAVPQIIIAFKERGQKEMRAELAELREQIAALQPPSS